MSKLLKEGSAVEGSLYLCIVNTTFNGFFVVVFCRDNRLQSKWLGVINVLKDENIRGFRQSDLHVHTLSRHSWQRIFGEPLRNYLSDLERFY